MLQRHVAGFPGGCSSQYGRLHPARSELGPSPAPSCCRPTFPGCLCPGEVSGLRGEVCGGTHGCRLGPACWACDLEGITRMRAAGALTPARRSAGSTGPRWVTAFPFLEARPVFSRKLVPVHPTHSTGGRAAPCARTWAPGSPLQRCGETEAGDRGGAAGARAHRHGHTGAHAIRSTEARVQTQMNTLPRHSHTS